MSVDFAALAERSVYCEGCGSYRSTKPAALIALDAWEPPLADPS